jgi:hypothetical protein
MATRGAAFEPPVDALERVAGASAALMLARAGEGGETLRDIFFHPRGEFGGGRGFALGSASFLWIMAGLFGYDTKWPKQHPPCKVIAPVVASW